MRKCSDVCNDRNLTEVALPGEVRARAVTLHNTNLNVCKSFTITCVSAVLCAMSLSNRVVRRYTISLCNVMLAG